MLEIRERGCASPARPGGAAGSLLRRVGRRTLGFWGSEEGMRFQNLLGGLSWDKVLAAEAQVAALGLKIQPWRTPSSASLQDGDPQAELSSPPAPPSGQRLPPEPATFRGF